MPSTCKHATGRPVKTSTLHTEDSITTTTATAFPTNGKAARTHELTPREVLSWLPKNATPAQQDSAIRQHIKPAAIHWSTQPDTLHMPGHAKGKSFRDVSLPQYYKESFFSKDSLFHPELSGGRMGVAGDPIPYNVAGDDFLTSLLLGCFILVMIALAHSRDFILRQAKNFFHIPRSEKTTEIPETSSEIRFQLFLVLQTCLLFTIIFFFYTRTYVGDTFTIGQHQLMGLYAGVIAAYFGAKVLCYQMVNWVFFDKKKNEQWIKPYLFIISVEGVLLIPIVLLLAFFNIAVKTALIYTLAIIILSKILSFYKIYIIFFREKGGFMQIILYFCTLEMMPLFTLWGALTSINYYLKIFF